MSRDRQIAEMDCKKCLHYERCVENFRRAKEEGLWELTTEEEYFSHANDCDMFITGYRKASDVAREIFEEIEKIVLAGIEKDESFREKMHTDTDRSYFEGGANSQRKLLWFIKELKKKYAEGNG